MAAIASVPLGFNCSDTRNGTEGDGPCETSCIPCIGSFSGYCKQKLPEGGAVLAPWVQVELSHGGTTLTVGNESTPGNEESANNAVIASFNFGQSDGVTATLIVHDQKGTQFGEFMDNILKDARCMESYAAITAKLQFGWIKSGCSTPVSLKRSACYHFMINTIEANFTGGKFIYEITMIDLMSKAPEVVCQNILGGDGEYLYLKDAIEKLLINDCPPNIASVKFLKHTKGGGTPEICKFKDGTEKGPKGKWPCNGRDKLHVVLKWLQDHRAEEGKSWVPTYNAEAEGGEMIFWCDPKPAEGETKNFANLCEGYYIVNGGKSSPVIEFSPRISWPFSTIKATGGNASSTTASANPGDKTQGRRDSQTLSRASNPCAGQLSSINTSENLENIEGKNAINEADAAQVAASKAMSIMAEAMTAELIIVGDPTLVAPAMAPLSRTVGIVFINPFHILESQVSKCGVWAISTPPCNVYLTNKAWYITGLKHSIELGSFKTTLQLSLPVPGVDMDAGEPLGGQGSGGWRPPNNCPSVAN